ncbi:cbb3-type cytochrome c oxidase subunit I [Helicobacter anatolicus]|uniref:cbb3-type cytochrome c oxidase subunit I n=1 Tax=Helicobacter anatolicus TaxID=2905874 RepID=UPI001E50C0FD|nr:cbb3-type cytochrome c oxidase subunit I [Helicobacter anatolicus]MCE3039069.1 cbb3-type cytochrome c oxidase subunit I [Helicobacter anatolicus]
MLDKFLNKKSLQGAFWIIAILTTTILIYFSANLGKEVPPLPNSVKSTSGETLYTQENIINGKGFFQEFGLMGYGTLLGMGSYMGPDFTTELMHKKLIALYEIFAQKEYQKSLESLSEEEKAIIKTKVINDTRSVQLQESGVTYSDEATQAFKIVEKDMIDFLVNGNADWGYRGKVITQEEAKEIIAFFDWSYLVATTYRPTKETTWSNNWPNEPLIDQNATWESQSISLWEWLWLWPLTILVLWISYEYLIKPRSTDTDSLAEPLKITSIFKSQEKLLKYVPIVALFSFIQLVLGGYLAHIYANPGDDFIISQELLPFNVVRQLHINIAIIWVTIGWLVGGLFIAPLVSGKDLKFPKLVDILWIALLVVGGGGLIGIYLGTQGYLRETWFWFGSEGREYLELGRVWDIGLLIGLVFWFLMVFTTIRKAKQDILVGTIIWSAFGIATLYISGMMPIHKIIPNFTVDDYYRWWVVHLWVELTFEMFASGVIAFLSVALGLVKKSIATRVMLFELVLIVLTGVLGVGHHYWWQGADSHWIAIGGIFSALEPLPLVILMIEAIKEQKHIKEMGKKFEWGVPFLWLAGSAFLNWLGAGWLGMVINTPIINYYSHGTYLIIPHGHVAMLGAFGFIAYAFVYMTAKANALAKGLEWSDYLSKVGFWLLTIGVVIYSIPTLIIGFHQTQVAFEKGYYFARLRETLEAVDAWMWFRILPDSMMIIGGGIVLLDLIIKIYFAKKKA